MLHFVDPRKPFLHFPKRSLLPSRRVYVEVRKTSRTVHWRPVSHPLGSAPTNPGYEGSLDSHLHHLQKAPEESDGWCMRFSSVVGSDCRLDLGERDPQDSFSVELVELLQQLVEEGLLHLLPHLPVHSGGENHTLWDRLCSSKCCAGDC